MASILDRPISQWAGMEYSCACGKSHKVDIQAIRVGSGVWFGAGCHVMPGVAIGDGAVIAAGSVVTQDIPAGVLAAGVPCRPVRSLAEAGPGET